jgi:cysteine-rich repeat protein
LHYVGPDAFAYQASDGLLISNIAQVTIGVAHASTCGDGVVQAGFEQCDDGNDDNHDGCLDTCVVARCGDGIARTGVEQCDDGNLSNNDACLTTCRVASCGDGSVFTGFEQCDDGNTVSGDGCDSTCHVEPPAAGLRVVAGSQLDASPMH